MTSHTFTRLLITLHLPDAALRKLEAIFPKIHYYPDAVDAPPPAEVLRDADVWFLRWTGALKGVKLEDTPNLRLIQLTYAGANAALQSPYFADGKWADQLSLSTASGIHVLSIPQWIIGAIVNLYMNIHNQTYILRTERSWPARSRLGNHPNSPNDPLDLLSMRGKTAGMLGYGHIARETARLLKAFGVEVVAANTKGVRAADEGYIIPGTGDPDGSIPSAYYSTTDPASFDEFLGRSEILIASLPSTPQTTYMLKKEHLFKLPKGAIFLNVGRGDLVASADILAALGPSYTVLEPPHSDDAGPPHPASTSPSTSDDGNAKSGIDVTSQGHLLGVGLDVTDPEPLPDNHPLYTHPRALVTPHTSGNFVGYLEAATDLLVANVEHVRKGGRAYNAVDPKKGY